MQKLILAVAIAALCAPVAAQVQRPRDEAPGGPRAPARAVRLSPIPPPSFWRGVPTSIQINTKDGQNIVGDAANEPSLTVDPTAPNRMAVGWRQFDSISSNFRQAGRAFSIDGGRTWTNPGVLKPGQFRTDPVLDTTEEGEFFYNSLYGTELTDCDTFESEDAGANWGEPVPSFGGDKNWMAIDRSGSAGHGFVYLIWSPFYSCCNGIFSRSTDGGTSYMTPIDVPGDPFFGTIFVGPSGEVYAAGIKASNQNVFVVDRSTNAKDKLQTPVWDVSKDVNLGGPARANTGFGPNPGGLLGQAWVATDNSGGPRNGWVYLLCSVDPAGTDPMDVMVARSTDGGKNWSAPVRINDDSPGPNSWQWLATLCVAPDGRLDVVWNDTRESGKANVSRLYSSSSGDGGATWTINQPLSPAWDSYLGWPQQQKIGDYYQLVSDRVGAHLAWAATFSGEQDVYYMRIGDYDCNNNGVSDLADIASGMAQDCNGNSIPDSCEIAAGAVPDENGNGVPDPCECYADCDGSGGLDIDDFVCFQTFYGLGDAGADCDQSGRLDIDDFICFQTLFGLGCP